MRLYQAKLLRSLHSNASHVFVLGLYVFGSKKMKRVLVNMKKIDVGRIMTCLQPIEELSTSRVAVSYNVRMRSIYGILAHYECGWQKFISKCGEPLHGPKFLQFVINFRCFQCSHISNVWKWVGTTN